MAKKDPSKKRDDDFKELGLIELDDLESDLGDLDVDTTAIDSNKERAPATKLGVVTSDLKKVGKSAALGAAAGVATKIKKEFPEVEDAAKFTSDTLSSALNFRDEVLKDIAPTLNQTKQVTKQLLRYADGLLPKSWMEKLDRRLESQHEETYRALSKTDARNQQMSEDLANIFKTQESRSAEEARQHAVERIIDQKVSTSRHLETTSVLGEIRNQAFFNTNFIRGPLTAYLKKSLELKYRSLYIAEDTLEVLRITSQMTEKKLDAIRHNTSLPDAQKIHLLEVASQQAKQRMIGGVQDTFRNFIGRSLNNLKENVIKPGVEQLGSMNDMITGLMDALAMEEEVVGKKTDIKRSVVGKISGFAGGVLGNIGARKLLNKLPPKVRRAINDAAAKGPRSLMLFLDKLRRGEIKFGMSEEVSSILSTFMEEVDRSAGSFDIESAIHPKAAGLISKKFVATVEEVIPGYLSMQTKLLHKIAYGNDTDRLIWDFNKSKFVAESSRIEEIKAEVFGSRDSRLSLLQGNIKAVREFATQRGKIVTASVEDVAKEISLFIQNLASSKQFDDLNINELKAVAASEDGTLPDSVYIKKAFRGLKFPKKVAVAILSIILNEDGSTNQDAKLAIERRISATMMYADEHRAAVAKMVENGEAGLLSKAGIASVDKGTVKVMDDALFGRFSDIQQYEILNEKVSGLDEFGHKYEEKTKTEEFLSGMGKLAREAGGKLKDQFTEKIDKIDDVLTDFFKKHGMDKEYQGIKDFVAKNYERLCKIFYERKEKFENVKLKVRTYIEKHTYEFMMERESFKPLAKLMFTEEGIVKEKLTPSEIAEFLGTFPQLPVTLARIHKADNPIFWVIDALLPTSLLMVAEMTEDEQTRVAASKNPSETIQEIMNERGSKFQFPGQKRNAGGKKPQRFNSRNNLYQTRVGGQSGSSISTPDIDKIREENSSYRDFDALNESERQIQTAQNEAAEKQKKLREYRERKQAATNVRFNKIGHGGRHPNRKASGGTIDSLLGTDVGTVYKPTFRAGGRALVGEHGAETIVPLNHTETAKRAYLEAKAYHEGNVYASGGSMDSSTGKRIRIVDAATMRLGMAKDSALGFLNSFKGNDSELNSAIDTITSRLVSIDPEKLGDKIYSMRDKASGAADKINELYEDLKNTDPKVKFKEIIGRLIKFVTRVKKYGVINEIPAGDRTTIKLIGECLSEKDFALSKLDTYPEGTTSILTKFIDKYRELYHKAATKFKDKSQMAKELYGKYKGMGIDKLNNLKASAKEILDSERMQKIIGTGKEWYNTAKDKLGGAAGFVIEHLSNLFSGPKGTLIEIATAQLETQQAILSVVAGGKSINVGDVTISSKKDPYADGFFKRNMKRAWRVAKFLGKDAPKAILTHPARAARDFVTNRATAVYLKPAANQELDKNLKLISTEQFKAGVFHDSEGKHLIKSVADINGAVYDGNGKILVTEEQYHRGLVDGKGKPIVSFGSSVGRLARHTVGATADAFKSMGRGGKRLIGKINPLGKIASVVTSPFKMAEGLLSPFQDVYVKDNLEEPLVTGKSLRAGMLAFSDGKPIKDVFSIDRPVVWLNIPENGSLAGQVAISSEDIERGLVNFNNQPLNKLSRKAGSLLGRGARNLVGGAWSILTGKYGIVGLATTIVKKTADVFFGKNNPYIDVYVPDPDGSIPKGNPRLTGENIKHGRYVYLNGKPVESAYGIKEAVYDATNMNQLISEEDIKGGLFDINGKKLTAFAGRSLVGKAVTGFLGASLWAGKKIIGGAIKAIGAAGRGVKSAFDFLVRGAAQKGSELLQGASAAFLNVLTTLTQNKQVKRKDLEEIVGTRLDNIYNFLVKFMIRRKNATLGDVDGDGIREGSYRDYVNSKKEREQQKADKKAAEAEKRKGGAAAAVIHAAATSGSDKGIIETISDWKDSFDTASDVVDSVKKSKFGRWMGGKFGAAKNVIGSKLGVLRTGAGNLIRSAASRVGMQTVARQGVMAGIRAGGAALIGKLAAGAGLAGSGAASIGAGLGGAITGLVSNPVGWGIAIGLVGYGGYKLAKWAFTTSDYVKQWETKRLEGYGVKPEQKSIIKDLEEDLQESLEDSEELSKSDLEEYAAKFGLIKEGFLGLGGDNKTIVRERMEYFTTWYNTRFRTIYELYITTVNDGTDSDKYDDPDPDDIPDIKKEAYLTYFERHMKNILSKDGIDKLFPTIEAFNKYKAEEEAKRKAEEEKSKANPVAAGAPITVSGKAEVKKVPKGMKMTKDGIMVPVESETTKPTALKDLMSQEEYQALLAGTGVKLFGGLFGDSITVTAAKKAKMKRYGVSDESSKAIEKLENEVYKIICKERKELNKDELRSFAEKFNLLDEKKLGRLYAEKCKLTGRTPRGTPDIINEVINFFGTWYVKRFRPVFDIYVKLVLHFGNLDKGDNIDLDEIDEAELPLFIKTFESNCSTFVPSEVNKVEPTLASFENAYLGKERAQVSQKKAEESSKISESEMKKKLDAINGMAASSTAANKASSPIVDAALKEDEKAREEHFSRHNSGGSSAAVTAMLASEGKMSSGIKNTYFGGTYSPSSSDAAPSAASSTATTVDVTGVGKIKPKDAAELNAQFNNTSITRGNRNNNPTNIRISKWSKQQPGFIDGDRMKANQGLPAAPFGKGIAGFARFSAPEYGIAATIRLIKDVYGKQGHRTIAAITNKFSPSFENDTADLIRCYSQASGFKPNEPINWNNQKAVLAYIKAKIKRESGIDYSDDVYARAFAIAYGSGNVSESGADSNEQGIMVPSESSSGNTTTEQNSAPSSGGASPSGYSSASGGGSSSSAYAASQPATASANQGPNNTFAVSTGSGDSDQNDGVSTTANSSDSKAPQLPPISASSLKQYANIGGSDISGVKADFMKRFAAAARDYYNATGKKVPITSAFRSQEKQGELWVRKHHFNDPSIYMPAKPVKDVTVKWKNQTFHVKGRGGTIKPGHLTGEAIDVSRSAAAQFEQFARKYGVGRPWPKKDPPHFTVLDKNIKAPDFDGMDTLNPDAANKPLSSLDPKSLPGGQELAGTPETGQQPSSDGGQSSAEKKVHSKASESASTAIAAGAAASSAAISSSGSSSESLSTGFTPPTSTSSSVGVSTGTPNQTGSVGSNDAQLKVMADISGGITGIRNDLKNYVEKLFGKSVTTENNQTNTNAPTANSVPEQIVAEIKSALDAAFGPNSPLIQSLSKNSTPSSSSSVTRPAFASKSEIGLSKYSFQNNRT